MRETRQYEVVYIVTPDAGEDVIAELQQQIEAIVKRFGGNIEKTENWGRRRLAYDIARHREGTYVLHVINGPGEFVHELDRRLKVIDQVVRHLVVRVDEELRVAERAKAKRRSESQRRRAARGLPPLAEGEEPRRRSEDQDEAPDTETEAVR
ncbi:MAG TPA: 30S ribosomal protein S6 [Vicinamibacterales bacterium]|jgi:small subunit ribosomal protein S6|nr:30S ribosomal protein S6 [Vicinamibacterales bacterium]